MQLILDATPLRTYPVGKEGFTGGTELYVRQLAKGLAQRGHTVHVVTPDLDTMEHRAPTLFFWPKKWHPTEADAVICVHNLERIAPYSADLLILVSNGLGADLGTQDEYCTGLDGVACFTRKHVDLLCQSHPKIKRDICYVTGLGVDLEEYRGILDPEDGSHLARCKVPGRLLFSNDPQRGLWHAVDIFEQVQKSVPDATLHVTYDWERTFESIKWGSTHLAAKFWDLKARIDANPGIVNRGELTRAELIREQLEAQVFLFPCDPQLLGSQLHCLSALEAAAAGCALVLSDSEALPEVFQDVAEILPIPGYFDPQLERRWDAQDWAQEIVPLLRDPEKWAEASSKARARAELSTWAPVLDAWDAMLVELSRKVAKSA